MIGGMRLSGTRWAVLALCSVLTGGTASANAADFGGDCCADLEERIAELEATTARKGNRKVSLEVSGHVNEAVMFWDDGSESNTYVVTNDSGRSRFRFRGKAKINSDWEAGYRLEIGVRSARSDRVDQGGFDFAGNALPGDDPGDGFDVRYSHWYLKSKTFGEIVVGQTEVAAQGITEINVSQTSDIAKLSDPEDQAAGFHLRASGVGGAAGLSTNEWRRLVKDDFQQPGEGNRGNVVHYISPEFAGFEFHAAWGEDDYWDVGVLYAGELGAFKIEGGIAYGEGSDAADGILPCLVSGVTTVPDDSSCRQVGGSLAIMHTPTGLFVQGAGGWFEDENIDARFANPNADEDSTFWAVQAGIEQKWFALGKTTLYGEYFNHDGGANDRTFAAGDPVTVVAGLANNSWIWNSEVDVYGLGVIQGIDAAAMRVYLFWRHYEADLTLRDNTTNALADAPLEDLDVVTGGAIIKF